MRVLFIFALLIHCSVALADLASQNDCYIAGQNGNCDTTPGCYQRGTDCERCESENFCPGGAPESCSEATGTFNNSLPGATSISDCYKSFTPGCYDTTNNIITPNCGLFYNRETNNELKCWTHTTNNYQDTYRYDDPPLIYHKETIGNNTYCYENSRQCSLFNKDVFFYGIVDFNNCGRVTGNATWTGNQWDISACRFSPDQDGCQLQNLNCISNVFELKPGNELSVSNVNGAIQYETQAGLTAGSYYYCTSCVNGYYVQQSDIQNCIAQGECSFPACVDDTQGFHVCKCSQTPQGYYMGSNGCTWTTNSQSSLNCTPTACPAGQTTDNPGATAASACHYTNDTQLCDNNGANCVSFSTLGIGWGDY